MTDTIGDRMKRYEAPYKFLVPQRTPIIVRVDGRAFHTFLRQAAKPFDRNHIEAMRTAMGTVAGNLQGCVAAYTQSDETSFVIQTDKSFQSQVPFGGRVDKLCSLVASQFSVVYATVRLSELTPTHYGALKHLPHFDGRVLTMPWEEVPNYLVWRYRDWVRNSITMMAQSVWSHDDLNGVSTATMLDWLQQRALRGEGENWEHQPAFIRHGYLWLVGNREINDYLIQQHEPITYQQFENLLGRAREFETQTSAKATEKKKP